jgi:glycerophosphoryl diester phosphodiesterase
MNNTLNNSPDYRENVVVGTYYSEVEEKIKEYGMSRGASLSTAAVFVITQMLKVNIFDTNDFACLQIPTYFDIEISENFKLKIWLDKKDYINRAHRRNIAVQYWTINDEEEMRELIELGCDCIMTDDPELLRNVLDSYK